MFNKIYSLVRQDYSDEALDELFNYIDDLLLDGKFEQANNELKQIDLTQLDTTLLVGVLCITLAAKHVLPYRAELYDLIEKRFIETEPDSVEDLLKGLK